MRREALGIYTPPPTWQSFHRTGTGSMRTVPEFGALYRGLCTGTGVYKWGPPYPASSHRCPPRQWGRRRGPVPIGAVPIGSLLTGTVPAYTQLSVCTLASVYSVYTVQCVRTLYTVYTLYSVTIVYTVQCITRVYTDQCMPLSSVYSGTMALHTHNASVYNVNALFIVLYNGAG